MQVNYISPCVITDRSEHFTQSTLVKCSNEQTLDQVIDAGKLYVAIFKNRKVRTVHGLGYLSVAMTKLYTGKEIQVNYTHESHLQQHLPLH